MDDGSGASAVIDGLQNARVEINDQMPTTEANYTPPPPPKTDTAGTVYDSAIHCYDAATGEPLLTKTGKFRKRAEGRAPSKSPARKTVAPSPGKSRLNLALDQSGGDDFQNDQAAAFDAPIESGPQIDGEVMLAAETCAEMYIQTGVALFGGEWLPEGDKTDREALVSGFYRYLHHKGIKDIPPGIALCMAMFGYAAPRFHKPKTSAKIAAYWTLIKSRFSRITNRAPRHDIRSNGVRQNAAGETHSEAGSRTWFGRPGT